MQQNIKNYKDFELSFDALFLNFILYLKEKNKRLDVKSKKV
jgi:hypothetical protein